MCLTLGETMVECLAILIGIAAIAARRLRGFSPGPQLMALPRISGLEGQAVYPARRTVEHPGVPFLPAAEAILRE